MPTKRASLGLLNNIAIITEWDSIKINWPASRADVVNNSLS